MISPRYMFIGISVAALMLRPGFSAEGEGTANTTETEKDSSSTSQDQGPPTAETIAQITNDPGAGFGGDR